MDVSGWNNWNNCGKSTLQNEDESDDERVWNSELRTIISYTSYIISGRGFRTWKRFQSSCSKQSWVKKLRRSHCSLAWFHRQLFSVLSFTLLVAAWILISCLHFCRSPYHAVVCGSDLNTIWMYQKLKNCISDIKQVLPQCCVTNRCMQVPANRIKVKTSDVTSENKGAEESRTGWEGHSDRWAQRQTLWWV